MKPPSLEDCRLDESYFAGGDHIKAMVIIEDSILKQGKGNDLLGLLHFQQGSIFRAQARRTENSYVKFTFLLGSVECFAESEGFSSFTALSLFEMGQHLGSSMYYKKSVEKAKEYLSVLAELDELGPKEVKSQKDVERIIEDAESRIAGGKSLVASPIVRSEPKAKESKKNPDSKLRSFWRGLDDEFKRNFLKMEITKLISFVEAMYGKEGRDALDQVLTFARENRKWRFWMCRTCSKNFSSPEECKNHLGQEHAAEFKPSSTKDMPQTVSKVWGRKISVGGWDPVDAAAAVEMIKNRLQDVKAFAYENGWSKDWPLAIDEERISEHTLTTECRLVETPQSICFLEFRELNQILHFLRAIKGERDDGKNLVCKAVDSFWDGTVNVFDPNDYYANAQVHGDDILSWLADYSLGDEIFRFPKPIRTHNIDIWVAVLRAVQFTCRTLRTKYEKKLRMICYDAALIDANNLCIREDERRRNIPEDQWTLYASLLCDKCEENIRRDAGDSLTTKLSLCAVRDVLGGASQPTFDFTDLVDCRNLINGHKHISDDIVLKSINLLKSVVTYKVPLVDSKILLVENSRISLLKDLVSLSVFDYRSYILQPVKLYLEEELEDAAPPELLSEKKQEKEKKSGSKKRNHKSTKRTSASMSSHLDQDVEQAKEDSMELEDDTKGEKSLFEISSNTNNQEEATKDMQSMPREDLETVNGKAATRYNSALDMMLKSLCNIKVLKEDLVNNRKPFSDNQVPCALRDFFSAFVSEKIKEEELYGHLLSNLLASLEELHSLSSNAAEVLVAILEFCHCWKSPESESLVTRLFTLEEYERMSCRKCRRKPNYPEQSSYGIVMAADSIRDLECALGNIMFEDILKVIRMNNEMICDVGTGGCGERNLVHHTISRCPPIFTIVLEWEKNETEIEIYETTNALHWEIDISRLYEGLEPNTNYRLVSMIGCVEEGEYICMAYEKNRWVSRRHEASAEEVR
ncbi:hypothetical protein AXX17_AT1G58730 [Arabidopsis thaliana]|uniref:C2H2-type domain-containing protein n=1 Tax=Arabidopsis thaliana TaxID=3702 RepID=A0A178WDB4_ARATH|nr:hypothetical protein AXX17_AT1G58730 [Arabidopsis thaliana]